MARSWPKSIVSLALVTTAWFGPPASVAFQDGSSPQLKINPKKSAKPSWDTAESGAAHLRVDSSMVLIPTQVTTAIGAPVTGLQREDFHVFEDGVEQAVRYFIKEDAPVSVGVLLDASGSMKDKRQKTTEAAARFFQTANRDDEFFLVEFGDRPRLSVPFTSDADLLYDRIRRNRPFGRTSLFDAVHLALEQMKQARHARKAIVILSDGGDNRSRHTFRSVRNAMLESDVQVFAIGIATPDLEESSEEERNGPELLAELAEATGGRHFPVTTLGDLPEISARVGEQLRSQYVLGYSPSIEVRDGKYRKVRLEVASPAESPKYRVAYRRGYYAPVN